MARGAFGAEHILTYRGHIESVGWTDCGVELMTKEMVFGEDNLPLSLFRLKPDFTVAKWTENLRYRFMV
ncbi:MAG: hypothetical protein IJU98_00005, partial [Synergistaceae bacterium]|nr:hypothetical protein [Synergistaceae bacterium]